MAATTSASCTRELVIPGMEHAAAKEERQQRLVPVIGLARDLCGEVGEL
jgi:hypothetical protein